MNIETLENISALGHKIIHTEPKEGIVANPYLHFISAHQNNLLRYKTLLDGQSTFNKKLYNFVARRALLVLSLQAKKSQRCFGDSLPDTVDVLFVSHFLRESDAKQTSDLYFGSIPQDLENQGIKTFTLLLNHAKTPWSKIKDQWVSKPAARALLPRSLGYKSEKNLANILDESANILREKRDIETNSVIKNFLNHAAIESGSPASRTALRLGRQIGSFVKELKPKLIITTYEGHSWERLVFANARLNFPEVYCIGYHHAVLFPLQAAMMSSLGSPYDPDLILTAGDISKGEFKIRSNFNNVEIKTLGSCRGSGAVKLATKPQVKRQCLVLPEGIISESIALISLAIKASKLNPQISYTLRLHPLLTPEQLMKSDLKIKELPENVTWSAKTLEEDCKEARWALYRGSSSIIAAVLSGAQPIYYAQESKELQIDPLKTMTNWRKLIWNEQELINHISDDQLRDNKDRQSDFDDAKKYCLNYFKPFNPQIISDIIFEQNEINKTAKKHTS